MTTQNVTVDKDDMKQLRLIEYVSDGVYRIELLSRKGDVLNTISRVSDVDLEGGKAIEVINFDSEEFGKQVMTGRICSQPICHAIGAFHKACVQS